MNFQTFSQVAFAFAVTPALLMQGLIYALVMGFVGGLLPGHPRRAAADLVGAARTVECLTFAIEMNASISNLQSLSDLLNLLSA